MQTTKAQISQRTCAVLPIIFRKYDSLTCYMQKIEFLSDMRARIQTIPTGVGGGGGGVGEGSNCLSREVRASFSSRKQMATYDFHGEVRTPCPLCLHPYQSFKQFEFTFYFAGPCQFTKRLLIISADAKGKDSMIIFKIKETAHINSGHVLF